MVIADEALAEFIELLTYIKTEGPKNAGSVRAAVEKRLDRLRRIPRTGHADAIGAITAFLDVLEAKPT